MKHRLLSFLLSISIICTLLPVGVFAEDGAYISEEFYAETVESADTEESASTEESVSTEEPVSTPTPTSTPEPTSTPKPTNTPNPTSTPKPVKHTHAYTDKVVKPTCTNKGYTSHVCSCGDSYKDKYTEPLGHNFKGQKCTVCGAKNPDYVASPANPFKDVAKGKYYYYPVLWAVGKNITKGTTDTTFSPNNVCNRAQMVTFLWRASGSPTPKKSKNAFVDVKKSAYYYKAVLWAVENGITKGVDKAHFAPDQNVSRGQAVTFLYRAQNEPKIASAKTQFTDVSQSSYCGSAVAWAAKSGVTLGVSVNSFAPNDSCTRAQIVTFLYRSMIPTYEVSNSKSESADGLLEIVKTDGHTGTFLLRAKGVRCNSGVQSVTVAVWSEKDKSDIFWYDLSNVSDGLYGHTGNVTNHKLHFGKYSAALYIYTSSNKIIHIGDESFSISADRYLYTKNLGDHKIQLILLGAPSGTKSINFAVKKVDDKNAKTFWYSATKSGSSYTATIDCKGYTASGKYSLTAYKNGKSTSVASTTFYIPKTYIMSPTQLEIYNATEKVYKSKGKSLKACFDYAASLPYYRATPEPQKGYTNSEWYALYGFNNGKGHCYVHAATFYWLAKNLGYECYYVQGYVPRIGGGLITHGWVEIIIDGTLYVCDPNFTNETGKNGYMITYGASGTWCYTKYQRVD